jgi:hypothetical protein
MDVLQATFADPVRFLKCPMLMLGDLGQFVAGDLHPYRWPITVGLLALPAAIIVLAYHRGWHVAARRHRRATIIAAGIAAVVVLAVAIPVVDHVVSPLWNGSVPQDGEVISPQDDPSSAATNTLTPEHTDSSRATPESVFIRQVVLQGEFTGADDFHFGRGKVLVIETLPGAYMLQFEDFSVRNGPGLFVYLSPSARERAEGFIELGRLKATDGAFGYEIPVGTDVSRFRSAIIWSKTLSVLFAVAPLAAVQ